MLGKKNDQRVDHSNLCKPCAVKLSDQGKDLKLLHSKTEKITCTECGRRRFGCTYEVEETCQKD